MRSSSSDNSAIAFANIVLSWTSPEGEVYKATIGGVAIRGDERRPSANSSEPYRFSQNLKVNAKNLAGDLGPGEAKTLLSSKDFEKLRKERGFEISIEVRDARPAEQQDETTPIQW